MNSRQILHVFLSIINGIAAFLIMVVFLFFGSVFLLMLLQTDFILSSLLVVLFIFSSIVGLVFAIFVGVKYYRNAKKPQ
jgi:hypothetical protein